MKQASLSLDLTTKKTRKREFLGELSRVVPWSHVVGMIEPQSTCAKASRPPYLIETMLRIHLLQQWFDLSDRAMEEALLDVPLFREFARLPEAMVRLPDESSILRFRHLPEKHSIAAQLFAALNATLTANGLMLKTDSVVDGTLIAAPSSPKGSSGTPDAEIHQTRKGNNGYFGMRAHIAVKVDSGLVRHHVCAAPEYHVPHVVDPLLLGKNKDVFADSGSCAIGKWSRRERIRWSVTMTPRKRKALDPDGTIDVLRYKLERLKASIPAKVEHRFRVIKRQFGDANVRCGGLAKNDPQLTTPLMVSNL